MDPAPVSESGDRKPDPVSGTESGVRNRSPDPAPDNVFDARVILGTRKGSHLHCLIKLNPNEMSLWTRNFLLTILQFSILVEGSGSVMRIWIRNTENICEIRKFQ